MERLLGRFVGPVGRFEDARSLDAMMPGVVKACADNGKDPMEMLAAMWALGGEWQALAVSYMCLLTAFPGELFALAGSHDNGALARALLKGVVDDGPLLSAVAIWSSDNQTDVIGMTVDWLATKMARLRSADLLPGLLRASQLLLTGSCLGYVLERSLHTRLLDAAMSCPLLVSHAVRPLLVASAHSLLLAVIRKERQLGVTYLLAFANANRDRLKMQAENVCSDGAAAVFMSVLLRLALPFSAASVRCDKLKLISPVYYDEYPGRLDISGFDRISQGGPVAGAGPGDAHFVSDCFYLAVHAVKMSFVRMIDDYVEVRRVLGELERLSSSPQVQANALLKAKLDMDRSRLSDKKAFLETTLNDSDLRDELFPFIQLMMLFYVRLYTENRRAFERLPEFYVEVLCEYWLYVSRFTPQQWMALAEPIDLFLNLALILLSDPLSARSVHMRAKMIEVLFAWTAPGADGHSRPLARLFHSAFHASYTGDDRIQQLPPVLTPLVLRMYVDVECTGTSSQFYDKFNIRHQLSLIVHLLYEHPDYRLAFQKAALRPESFLRFQNLLLNDCTYLLDESISKLAELHTLQARGDRENIDQLERQLQSFMQLANATLTTLVLFTGDVRRPFARPEIVGRLAAMLLVNMKQLVGSRCRGLIVKDPKKYYFDPKWLIGSLSKILVNMADEAVFLEAVRSDYNYQDGAVLQQVVAVLERTFALTAHDFDRFRRIVAATQALPPPPEDALGEAEAPPDLLDPLMFTLMKDPVRLRTSRVTVDRSTIMAHLLNDPHDPFNRAPMSEADVEDDVEMKARVDAWLLERCRLASD